jgi:HK97 family phage portal protein
MTFLSTLIKASTAPDPTNDFWYVDPQSGFAYMPGGSNPEAAMRNSAVYDCVRLLSEDVAKLPLILYRRLPDGGKERATNHPLHGLLKTDPNGWQTSFEFRQLLQAHLELRGNAYSRIYPGPRGPVDRLEPIDPDSVTSVYRNTSGKIVYEVRRESDRVTEKLLQEEIFHLRGFSLNGLTGISTIGLHHETIGIGLAAQQFQTSSLKNGIRLSGVFLHPGTLGKESKQNLRESIASKFQGSGKAGGFMILEEGMQWKEMSMTMQDAQFLELRKLNRAEIAAIFRVPPHKIGDLDRATFSNIEHQSLEYVIDALMSRLVRWEQAISRDLIVGVDRETYFAEFLVDSLLRGDLKSRYDAYAVGINTGILSPNEARAFENMNARDGGDRFLQPLNMTTSGAKDQQRVARVFRLVGLKLANKELVAFRKASAKFEGKELIEWAEEFYRGYRESLRESLQLPKEKADRYCDESLAELKAAGCINDLICGWESNHAERLVELAFAA